jgi:hypothetical protein
MKADDLRDVPPESQQNGSTPVVALLGMAPLAWKLDGAVRFLESNQHPKADRLREYRDAILKAVSDGQPERAANLAWEAAHCWLHAD